jgi:hypothetical protein
MTETWDFSGLRALYVNCTLKRTPEVSNTGALVDASRALMERHGVATDSLRLIDHDVATGVWPDMTEHGWATTLRSRSAASSGSTRPPLSSTAPASTPTTAASPVA